MNAVGAHVRGLVCDGSSVNLCTLNQLGAELVRKPFFNVPSQSPEIFVFLDNCHLIKLARNCLSDLNTLVHENQIISWRYIERLHQLQEEEGLHLANKLSARNVVDWRKIK